jgi:Protein of unknown function (DUF2946)
VRKLLAGRRAVARIALIAMLFNALMPVLSPAIAGSGARSEWLAEVCHTDGTQLVLMGANPASDNGGQLPDGRSKPTSCPYCCSHASSIAVPSPGTDTFAVFGGADSLPTLYYRSPRPLFSWSQANPRAPPALA